MNDAARYANEKMDRDRIYDLLRSIDASLKVLVERSTPAVITFTPGPQTAPTPSYPWVNS